MHEVPFSIQDREKGDHIPYLFLWSNTTATTWTRNRRSESNARISQGFCWATQPFSPPSASSFTLLLSSPPFSNMDTPLFIRRGLEVSADRGRKVPLCAYSEIRFPFFSFPPPFDASKPPFYKGENPQGSFPSYRDFSCLYGSESNGYNNSCTLVVILTRFRVFSILQGCESGKTINGWNRKSGSEIKGIQHSPLNSWCNVP